MGKRKLQKAGKEMEKGVFLPLLLLLKRGEKGRKQKKKRLFLLCERKERGKEKKGNKVGEEKEKTLFEMNKVFKFAMKRKGYPSECEDNLFCLAEAKKVLLKQ